MKRMMTTAALALGLSAAALSPSFAQTTDQTANQPQPMMSMMGGNCPMMGMMDMHGSGMMGHGMMNQGNQSMMGQGMMGGQARMDAMADGRLAYLKAELDITDDQMTAWDGYADAVKSRVDTMQGMRQDMMTAMQSGDMSARMDARISGMEAMVDAMKAVKPATEELYASLNDEQKKKADQLIGVDCGAM